MSAVCRIGWPYRRTIRFIDKASRSPRDFTGQTFTQKIFETWDGAVLATFTTAAGHITPAAGGRLVWDVPASAMAAPLRAGTFPMEVRRTDDGSNAVILTGLITIGKAVTA